MGEDLCKMNVTSIYLLIAKHNTRNGVLELRLYFCTLNRKSTS